MRAAGDAQTVKVTAVGSGCPWIAVSNASWIHVTFGASNNAGSGSFGYAVDPNSGPARTGTITAAGLSFTVTQAGCAFTLVPASANFPAGGGTGTFNVQTAVCTWNATTGDNWITITSGSGGPGSGTISYTVAANPATARRSGNINVGGTVFAVNEDACTVALVPNSANLPVGGGSGTFQVTPTGACTWTAKSGANWLAVTAGASGSGTGTVAYTAAANTGAQRSGGIQVNEQTFPVNQAGCAYTVTPALLSIGAAGGPGSVSLTAAASCAWTASSGVSWIQINGAASGAGSAPINFTAAPNPGAQRTGTVSVAGQTITVAQAGASAAISLSAVANSASYAAGAVSPGEIVTLFGANLGPSTLVPYDASSGKFATALAGTRVLFDGVAAPLVYTSAAQVSAVAPYGISNSTRVQVEYQGTASNALPLDVAAATPGIFSLDSSGAGQGAVLNQDYSVNGAANPAVPGSVVQIFLTGGGQTNPPGIDGALAGAPPPLLALPVTATIGGVDAPVQYAGAAPGLVAGVVQVNASVPAGLAAGPAAVIVAIGGVSSQAGVTIAVGPEMEPQMNADECR